jgi:amino acid transporter
VLSTSAFAITGLPEYVSMFSFLSTYGGFAIAVIYLLISVGALRGLRSADKTWQLYSASVIGIAVTVAAIYGAIYKVAAPTVYAPYGAIGVLVLGLVASFLVPSVPSGVADFSGLSEGERGPVKI